MKTLTFCLSLLAFGLATAAVAQDGPRVLPGTFKGARLGMSVDHWKTLAPPEGSDLQTRTVCSNQPGAAAAGVRVSASEAAAGVVACTYATRDGAEVVPQPIGLATGETATDVSFRFRHGRLDEIRFQTPVGGYNDMVQNLTADYGAPDINRPDGDVSSDQPVRVTWRTPDGTVTLAIPGDDTTEMSVRYRSR